MRETERKEHTQRERESEKNMRKTKSDQANKNT